jgi:hypothetical protein
MKSITFYISLLFIVLSNHINGQQACLQNGGFANACSNVITISGICPTWTDACGDGWVRSHGSPQMIYYNDGKNMGFYAFMWSVSNGSNYNSGEGMFTPYSFLTNHTYNVKIRISTSNSNGTVFVYAANGLAQSAYNACGNSVPTISQKQLIGSYTGFTNGWITLSFPAFTPTANYSQIWIYPFGASLDPQYNLGVMHVSACPSCEGTITYNNGVVPTGETMAGYINVGSTAGTGGVPTVTVQPNQTTSLIGVSEVDMLPEFNAVVTTGSFSATSLNCGSLPSGRTYLNLDSANIELPQSNEGNQQTSFKKSVFNNPENNNSNQNSSEFQIYPNPTRNKVNIDFYSGKEGRIKIRILNNVGIVVREIFSSSIAMGTKHIDLDIGSFSSGLYLIQVIDDKSKVIVKKIQKLN